ncbi:Asp-domain-containing protein [Gyrodon lividus]|nr:Asp-domain-containing protein [Gyrodon lividus]
MHFTLATAIAVLPFVVAAIPQGVKQGGTAIQLSKRSSLVNADKSVNFEVLKSHVASTRAKILRGFDNFEKNTGASHPSDVKRARKRASGGIPLDPFDVGPHIWFGAVSIGTPPKTYTVMFDTGSSDLVLPGVDCDDSCNGHAIYDPASSSSSVNLGEPFVVQYGSGDSAFGDQYTDNVTIVGLTATDQTFGVALHYSRGFQIEQFPADGVMGMGFQPISRYHQSPVFQTFVTQGYTDEPVFAFNFADPEPELYLGGTNPNMYTGDFTYAEVTTVGLMRRIQGYWQVNMVNIVVNGEVVLSNVDSIVDTGDDFIHGPPEDVAALYQAIGGTPLPTNSQLYTFPCDDVPSVSFTFGDTSTSFLISAETIIVGPVDEDPLDCIGAIIVANVPFWVVGGAFLRNVYTVFDVANERVGFAELA